MNADYFLKKFRSIPQALWTTGSLYNGWTYQCCAMGFCDNIEKQPLRELFRQRLGMPVHHVNDFSHCDDFPQKTPKERILAALEYIKSL